MSFGYQARRATRTVTTHGRAPRVCRGLCPPPGGSRWPLHMKHPARYCNRKYSGRHARPLQSPRPIGFQAPGSQGLSWWFDGTHSTSAQRSSASGRDRNRPGARAADCRVRHGLGPKRAQALSCVQRGEDRPDRARRAPSGLSRSQSSASQSTGPGLAGLLFHQPTIAISASTGSPRTKNRRHRKLGRGSAAAKALVKRLNGTAHRQGRFAPDTAIPTWSQTGSDEVQRSTESRALDGAAYDVLHATAS